MYIKKDENGQMYIDFNLLKENIDEDLMLLIEEKMKLYDFDFERHLKENNVKLKIDINEHFQTVYIITFSQCYIFEKALDDHYINPLEFIHIPKRNVRTLFEMMEGEK